ncbi:MAG: prenyltransferase [Lactococcus lactis]|uniref:1,4-dihydroxy-2-naphthoate prenyltransferase n=2 Tax=Lactococcus lactis subsp. cremoris TaxID=1359 RepID=T0WSP8_LACLC|nr:prenyltransferase [Lactococcus cremoris]EQC96269.1 1,4-dihydroxy-2-naphthoate prenyltransferase [Lactococcus cremoris subsp. cremoris TIFN3]MDU1526109.1 prenyltransferase [Lactococcus lactis]MCT0499203.1 1,4-dihydroxy-2-naphthoate polyprenyltransferase [Lactococcus cremoris]MCT4400271.1 1,4-dihydroxy-2-naphthoate polyprenyltransferase [Lactococcus cremoris]MCT4427875.1 1,4-dihydroxy-2-naphthoate polyprenyltransferase [Lactococcus cremoris]
MNFKIFAELIELKAKTASIFPFLLGLAYSLYHYKSVNLSALAIYFVAMFMFNCFVDIWDNYNDYHKAVDTDDYQKNTNIIGRENLSMGLIKSLLAFFFFGSLILGIIVALMTGWAVFWLGLLCYAVGVFYAGGPKPLSSLPLGELLSGLTMGYVIFLICLYINSSQNFVWSFANLATTFLIALPNTLLIANLMLANNTCDLEEDEANHRYTIVHYIGKKAALIWWTTALILAFVAIVVAVILGLLSPIMLLILLIAPLMIKFARPYLQKQVKKETFISSVKILMVFQLVQVLLFFVSLIKF